MAVIVNISSLFWIGWCSDNYCIVLPNLLFSWFTEALRADLYNECGGVLCIRVGHEYI